MRNNISNGEELAQIIDVAIKVGTEVPKTDGRTRMVTKKVNSRIYMRTGVQTSAEKYTTKEMILFAYDKIQSGEAFTAKELARKFPREYRQGSCVFSMTGGILELLDVARYTRSGYILK